MDRKSIPWRLSIASAIALLALSAAASGQVILGSIAGTVTDETGAALPGVTITLTSPALQVPQLVRISEAEGAYQFSELPIGLFRVTYELPGFGTLVREQIRLTGGFAARVDVVLNVATVAETVTVTGESPLVDVTNTRGTTTVSEEILQSTPNSGTMQDAYLISGGVTLNASPLNGEGGVRSIMSVISAVTYGQAQGANSGSAGLYQTLDGVLTYSNQLPDLYSLEEVSVKTYGNTAEVGSPSVATVMIVKSGGNQFHGRVREAYQHKSFSSDNVDDRLRAQGISAGREIQYFSDFSANLGGRIIRDKLWFFGAYHNIVSGTYLPGFALDKGPDRKWGTTDDTPATNKSSEPTPTIKLSYQATTNHRFIGFYSKNTVWEDSYFQGAARFIPFESTHDYSQPFPTAKGEWQGTVANRFFISLLAGRHAIGAYRNAQPCCAHLVSTFDLVTQQQTGSVWSDLRGFRQGTRYQQSGAVNYIPGGSFLGTHQISAGYHVVPEKLDAVLPVEANGDYRLVYSNSVPVQLWTRNTPVKGVSWQAAYSAYVSDSWRMTRRLTVNAGLRWERTTAHVPAQFKEPGPWPFERVGALPAIDIIDWKALAPRFGTAFDLLGDGKMVVKSTYGVYNETFGYGWAAQFNPNYAAGTRYRWTDPTGCNCYVPGTVNLDPNGPDVLSITGASNTPVNPDLKLTYTHEATASIERELPRNVSLRALYVFKQQVRTKSSVNILRPYAVWNQQITRTDPGPDARLGTADDGGLITFYDYDPAYRGSRFVANTLVNTTDRADAYNNLELRLEKRRSNKWFALTSLIVTKNHRWLRPVVESPNDELSSGDELFSVDDTWTWSYRLSGGYELPTGILLSSTTQVDNGLKGQRTVVFSAPSSGTLSIPVEPFGASTSPLRAVVNLRVSKDFQVGGGRTLGLELNAFNLFNTNVTWVQTFVSGPTFSYVTDYVAPRVLRLGASFEF